MNQCPDEEPRLSKGRLLLDMNRPDQAREYFLEYLADFPEDPEGLHSLGISYRLENRLEEALDCYQQTLAAMPDACNTCADLAFVYYAWDNKDAAIEHLFKSLELNPEARKYYWLFRIYSENGDHEKAVAALKAGLELDPDDLSCRIAFLEEGLDSDGVRASMFEAAESLLAEHPENLKCQSFLGRLWLRSDPCKSESIFRNVLSQEPTSQDHKDNVLRSVTAGWNRRFSWILALYRLIMTWPMTAMFIVVIPAIVLSVEVQQNGLTFGLTLGCLFVLLMLLASLYPPILALCVYLGRNRVLVSDEDTKKFTKHIGGLALIWTAAPTYALYDSPDDLYFGLALAITYTTIATWMIDEDFPTEHWVFPEFSKKAREKWNFRFNYDKRSNSIARLFGLLNTPVGGNAQTTQSPEK